MTIYTCINYYIITPASCIVKRHNYMCIEYVTIESFKEINIVIHVQSYIGSTRNAN